MGVNGTDVRLGAVDAAIRAMQGAEDLTERERAALDALQALRAMLHDVATAGAAVQQERDGYSQMLRDFADWSRRAQALMTKAADELKRCAAPHPLPDFDAMRIAVQLRKAVDAVKDPEELGTGTECVDDVVPAIGRRVLPPGEDS